MRLLSHTLLPKLLLVIATVVLGATGLLAQATFVSLDAPGAGTGIGQGTFPVGINSKGVIAGWYFDSSFVTHPFLRQANGIFTEFTPSNLSQVALSGINDSGQVVGTGELTTSPYSDVGFIRDPDGKITTFSVSGAQPFSATAINNQGEIAGYYFGSDSHWYAYVRDASGNITSFSDPNETTATGNGTYAWAINDRGEVAGYYNYNNLTGINRGYVRSQLGSFKNFDAVPGGTTLMEPLAINLSGEVTGYYGSAATLVTNCFLRDSQGNITDFEIPDSSASIATGINDAGLIVGYWMVENQLLVDSFLRDAAGNVTTFAAPTDNYGTFATSINHNGQITGNWQDNVDFVNHGFIETGLSSR